LSRSPGSQSRRATTLANDRLETCIDSVTGGVAKAHLPSGHYGF
jgi:hypothetical protein